ncbi:MAG: hypothetical protein RJA98_2963, partial [Pseudomonadota bacterium]
MLGIESHRMPMAVPMLMAVLGALCRIRF